MKKLMIALAVAATTMFSFGDLPTGTSFEAFSVGPKTVGDIVTKDDTGDQDGQYKYWYSTATESDELGAITNDVASGVSRPDMFANESSNTNSLQIDTTAPLVRTALPNTGVSNVTAVAIGDGIYLDTLVKFTAADEAFAENLTGGDKIAIEYVEHEAEGDDVGYTNFVVRAGLIGEELGQTNYFAAVPAGFNKDEWHRLTVRTIADVGDGNVGFVIYLDGNMEKTLEYSKDVDAGFGSLNALAQTFYNTEKHALFPSAIAAGATGGSTISSVAFSGNGFIDDVSFTATKPTFINEAIRVTIAWDEHVTGMTINGTILTSEQVAAKSWTGELAEGSVIAIPTFAAGYVAGAPVLPAGATYDSETKTFGNLTSGMTCTIKSMFPLYEVNGVAFDDLDAALTASATGTAQNPATLKLLADCNKALSFTEGYVILDLAGHDLQATSDEATFTIANMGANLIITNSGVEASVKLPTGSSSSGLIFLSELAGFTTIQAGTFEGYIYCYISETTKEPADMLSITGGKFLDQMYDESDPQPFYLVSCVAAGLETKYLGSNYFQVGGGDTPQPTTFALTTTGGANATVTTDPADVSALTEATNVTITATAAQDYTYDGVDLTGTDWTYDSQTDAISMTTNISEKTTVVVPDAVSEQQSGYDSGDGEHTFVIDSATEDELEENLPTGKTLASAVSEGSSLTYAQAYALGLWDATATTVTDLDATISVAADGKVTVTLANAPTSGYLVQCKVYEKASLTAEWPSTPVATYAYGNEQAFTPGSATAGFYKVAVVITNSLQQ